MESSIVLKGRYIFQIYQFPPYGNAHYHTNDFNWVHRTSNCHPKSANMFGKYLVPRPLRLVQRNPCRKWRNHQFPAPTPHPLWIDVAHTHAIQETVHWIDGNLMVATKAVVRSKKSSVVEVYAYYIRITHASHIRRRDQVRLGRSARRGHLLLLYSPICKCISSNNVEPIPYLCSIVLEISFQPGEENASWAYAVIDATLHWQISFVSTQPMLRDSLRTMLEMIGWELSICSSGETVGRYGILQKKNGTLKWF